MADWRQIQARIRKAKTSSDPPAQLAELYERTRDAMVAFELAQWQENAGANAEAARWYTAAAQRFRRAQWRTKAEEALTRLGAPIPVATAEPAAEPAPAESLQEPEAAPSLFPERVFAERPEQSEESAAEELAPPTKQPATSSSSEGGQPPAKRRRRGRRGGRGRRSGRGVQAGATEASSQAPLAPARSLPATPHVSEPHRPVPARPETEPAAPSAPERSYEPAAASPAWQARTRAGEPALASRIAQLESQLRRLLACQQVSLEDADQAPAGPGVFLLSDSDQVSHYYIEACQTLRIGIANLLRGGRGGPDAGRLKERLAENLGIAESRVSKYLKDHCAVRWLQLDEGAPQLAHFAIAVLRPVVNE